MNNEETQLDDADKFLTNSEATRNQTKRFKDAIRKQGIKHVKSFEQQIIDGHLKNKDLTGEQLRNCLLEACADYDLKQADKSAKRNRKMPKR